MSTFKSAFKTAIELVDDFKANDKIYLSSNYSEADVRNDFINKFFIALGWDVRHEQQKNPYEQEVRVEKPVQVAKAQKRADYTFYLTPNFRDVKFFVEAKKPFHDIENKDYFFQTVRYGWNANTPIAVLTDFEEFIILDCRYRPDIKDILNFKIKSFHYSDYANEEKFKEIYFLFSREAVTENSIEKYAEDLPKPKGKKIQKGLFAGRIQSIDESFLEELDEIRTVLAKSFKKNNTHLTSEELTEATQRTIDRLVFIKFLEDKMIEPHHYVSTFVEPHPNPSPSKGEGLLNSLSLQRRGIKGEVDFTANGKDAKQRPTAWEKFIRDSITLDAKYNGVVFKKCLIDSKNIIEPDDKTFSKICEDLSHENTVYNFDAIPIHILGSIYERFLGKVVSATDKRVTIEEKPEVRKAGGVYYTPQYIVNYIVDNTIGKLIEGKTPKEIAKMRFADIACGSGSFLITVYERLLDYYKRWYIKNPEQAKKDGCIFFEGAYRLSLQQKQKILTHNIYGVDLDHQAVEVTQLSLYLKLLEDETTATANDTWVMFKEKLLPDLSRNIVNGNSLIGTDILDLTLQFPLLAKERGRGEVDELKLKPMDFEKVFPEVFKPHPNHLLLKERGQDNGGFDAIVGNPPYVNLASIPEIQRKYFQDYYDTCKNKSDLYSFFIEKALKLCKTKNYKLGYIIPHTWLATDSFSLLRKELLDEKRIEKIIELGFGVFKKVVVSTVILICSDKNKNIEVLNSNFDLKFNIENENWVKENYHIDLDYDIDKEKVYEKLKNNTEPLENIIRFTRGIKTSDDKKFVLKEKKGADYKKLFRGRNIKAYKLDWENEFIWYRPDLMKKKVGCLPHTKELFEVPEKLVTQRVNSSMQLLAAYDNEQNYFLDTTNVSRIDTWNIKYPLKFILALLNSKLINYWYCNKFKMPTIGLYELHSIPIHNVNFNSKEEIKRLELIVRYVDQILTANKQLQQAKTESDKNYLERKCENLDKEIDQLVYELYGLTEEEIRIVEGNTSS